MIPVAVASLMLAALLAVRGGRELARHAALRSLRGPGSPPDRRRSPIVTTVRDRVRVLRERATAARTAARRDEQLADAVRTMASSLRAGMSATQAFAQTERDSAAPLRGTLASMNHALALGEPFDRALGRWADEVDTEDARLVTGVLRLHRRSGGDLPTVLDQVAGTLRERQAIVHEVRALTSQARLSGLILGLLPIGFLAFLWLTSRAQIEGALRTSAGLAALVAGLILDGLAFLWIRRLLEVR